MKKAGGFTLIESLVATAVLVIVVGGALEVFNRSFDNSNLARNDYIYLMETQRWMDELIYRSEENFGNALTTYNGTTFTSPIGANNRGVIYVINRHPGTTAFTTYLLRAKVAICWDEKGRIIGEDANLNGVLDAGEDANGNGEIDSPCQLETVLVRKD